MPTDPRVKEASDRLRLAILATEHQYKQEKEDLQFQVPEKQWPDDIRTQRSASVVAGIKIPAQPMLSVSTIDEPLELVLSQERNAHLGVQVHALSEDASDDTAEILQGLYRTIERDSQAGLARSWAFDRAVKVGRGFYRILTVPDRNSRVPGDQKIVIKRILYQSAVYLDPFAQEPDWSDGEWAFIISDLPWKTYQRKYGKSTLAKMDVSALRDLADDLKGDTPEDERPSWIGGTDDASRTVRVAEYFYVEHEHTTTTEKNWKGEDVEVETETNRRVMWCLINAVEVIAEQELNGQYIPIVPMIGKELQPFDDKRRWFGMIRTARDGVQLTNFAASNAVKMAALEPQAPWQAFEGAFEGHEEEYGQSNVKMIPYLQSKRTGLDGQPIPLPIRVQADMSRLGPSMELLRMGRDFVQSATSTFDPALGKQPTAHRSGRALIALQDQSVEATSRYVGNEADISIPYESLVVLDMIPRVYDRPGRVAQILDENDKAKSVVLNAPFAPDAVTRRPTALPYETPEQQAQVDMQVADPRHPAKFYDLSKGRYGVSVTIGKTSSSRLQQGADEMGMILQAEPTLLPVIGPEYFKFRDFPGAQQISKLLAKMRDHDMPWLAENPNGQGDSAQKLAMAEATMKEMHAALTDLQKQIDADTVKTQGQVEIKKAEFARDVQLQTMKDATQIAVAKISALTKGVIADKEAEDEALALNQQHAHEAATANADHARTMAQADQVHQQTLEQGDAEHQQTLVQGEQAQSHGLETQAATPPPTTEE